MNQHLTGLPAWLVQRLSAVYMAVYTLIALPVLLLSRPADHAAWYGLFASPWVSTATALFFVALGSHAWIGMRDVILDYAGGSARWRLVLLALLGGALLVMEVWMVRILLKVWSV